MEKKTVLYNTHVALGGKMVPYGGYLLPVQYGAGVIAEHRAVREKAGLFDVSHMGEFFINGPGALPFLQNLLCNNYADMQPGTCRYSPMCNEEGGTVDDLIVYKFAEDSYMLVVNAANRAKDLAWLTGRAREGVRLEDKSDDYALLALQGPCAESIAQKLTGAGLLPEKNYSFCRELSVAGVRCIASRTGYTGEDGFEFYCAASDAGELWATIVDAGQEFGLLPCGLAARDTLRLEAGMPLYGHELAEDITPLEAGLGYFVKLDKPNFVGREALVKAGKPTRRRTGLKITGRGIAREGAEVFSGEKQVGRVTSGTQLPYVGYAGAMALIEEGFRDVGTVLEVDVRGRRIEAQVVKLPFYKRPQGSAAKT